jgi:hypothetical protein
MVRFFILALIVCLNIKTTIGQQNLLINGDFEIINPSDGTPRFYLKNFYAKDWIEPTDGSVDIYRDTSICAISNIKNIEEALGCCVPVVSGQYCIGFRQLTYRGYMEHITGRLREPLEKGEIYKISFYAKFFGNLPFFSKGLGYKFSKDSCVFDSKELFEYKLSPFYPDLFGTNKVYSDFEIGEYITSPQWRKYTTIYIAKGGEKFITFGKFAMPNDKKGIKQIMKFTHNSSTKKEKKLLKKNNFTYFKIMPNIEIQKNNCYGIGGDYYLLDNVKVEAVSKEEKQVISQKCTYCVDTDELTINIPNRREIKLDKGFFGDMKLELKISLKPMEMFVFEYGKNSSIKVVNTGEYGAEYQSILYTITEKAKKLKKKPLVFYVQSISKDELNTLYVENKYLEEIKEDGFTGVVFKKK